MLMPPLRLVLVAVALLGGALLALPSLTRPTMMPAGVSSTPANGVIAFQPDEGHIHKLDPTTGRGSLWLLTDPSSSNLGWSPDGTRLAYATPMRDGPSRVHITCVPRPEACGTPPDDGFQGLRLLRWAPDGSRLLVVSEVDGRGVITLVPADGADGAMSETLDLGMTVDWATWHPDGTSLLVKGIGADGVPQFYSVSLEGTRTPEAMLAVDTTTALYRAWGESEFLWDPAYSPDGRTTPVFHRRRPPAWAGAGVTERSRAPGRCRRY